MLTEKNLRLKTIIVRKATGVWWQESTIITFFKLVFFAAAIVFVVYEGQVQLAHVQCPGTGCPMMTLVDLHYSFACGLN